MNARLTPPVSVLEALVVGFCCVMPIAVEFAFSIPVKDVVWGFSAVPAAVLAYRLGLKGAAIGSVLMLIALGITVWLKHRHHQVDISLADFFFLGATYIVGASFSVGVVAQRLLRAHKYLRDLNASLEAQSSKDGLTGLLNHSAFEAFLEPLIKGRESFVIVMIDLDKFKRINDFFGHQIGDQTLKRFAAVLASSLADGELASRYGGDEFILLLRSVTRQEALARLLEIQQRTDDDVAMTGLPMNLSYGVVLFPEEARTSDDLVRLADEAMYAMKRKHS